jgi:uncharacterized C2H2 Zn-finger protein
MYQLPLLNNTCNRKETTIMTIFSEYAIKHNANFRCDSCKKIFKAKEVKLVEPSSNFSATSFVMPFIFVNKDDKITGGNKSASKELGDKLFACPHCDYVHLCGFDSE